jgi:arsenite-transporting ATPase
VTNPEKIVMKETQRAFMYFSLYRMTIDGIIMNRVLPERVQDDFFSSWSRSQKAYMDLADAYFSPVPIFSVQLLQDEVLGHDCLLELGERIYGGRNPVDIFFRGRSYQLEKEESEYRLTITLPFLQKGDIELHKLYDELILRIGSFKKHLLLPRQVAASGGIRARLEGNNLNIFFRGDGNGKAKK